MTLAYLRSLQQVVAFPLHTGDGITEVNLGGTVGDGTAGSTIYTVESGKIFYVTDMSLHVYSTNGSGVTGAIGLTQNSNVIYPLLLRVIVVQASAEGLIRTDSHSERSFVTPHTLVENDSVSISKTTDKCVVDYYIHGYLIST